MQPFGRSPYDTSCRVNGDWSPESDEFGLKIKVNQMAKLSKRMRNHFFIASMLVEIKLRITLKLGKTA